MSNYQSKEKQGNIKTIIYETKALPTTTPCDLTGRPMVAPPSEAMRNIELKGNLNLDKW
jgi:hypothetical protein